MQRIPIEDAGPADPAIEEAREARRRAPRGTTVGRLAGRIARAGVVLGRALLGQRVVGREDTGWIALIAVFLLLLAVAGVFEPRLIAWPIAFFLFWLGVASLFRAWRGGGRD